MTDPRRLFRGDQPFRISVVLPACHESPDLQRTFEQFRATLPPRSEIVVVDNGSTEGCSDFLVKGTECPASPSGEGSLRDLPADDAGIAVGLYRCAAPLGVAGARNQGLAYARGEVIVFADAQVDVQPDWWQPIVATLNRPAVGMVGPALTVMGEPDRPKMYGLRVSDDMLGSRWLPMQRETPYPVPLLPGTFMVLQRGTLDAAGAFDSGMQQRGSEDLELSLRLWLMGYELWVVPGVEVAHYFRGESPYKVERERVVANQLRTILLYLSGERLACAVHAFATLDPQFPRLLAGCVESDVWSRRADLAARRVHDLDWFLNHAYFRAMNAEG